MMLTGSFMLDQARAEHHRPGTRIPLTETQVAAIALARIFRFTRERSPFRPVYSRMARFRIVQLSDAPYRSIWTVEEVTPGEKPVPIPFYGSRSEVEAELTRLNAGGEIVAKVVKPVRRIKRARSQPPAR
jgi:hypothetical protein